MTSYASQWIRKPETVHCAAVGGKVIRMMAANTYHNDPAWLARNGRLCCVKHDTWCALINLSDGSCDVKECPVEHRAKDVKNE